MSSARSGRAGGALLAATIALGTSAHAAHGTAEDAEVRARITAEREGQKRERATLLALHLPDATRASNVPGSFGVVLVGIGAAELAFWAMAPTDEAEARAAALASSLAFAGGAAAGFAAPQRYRLDTWRTTALLGTGGTWASLALLDTGDGFGAAAAFLAAGYSTAGFLSALNLAFARPPSARALHRQYLRVAVPSQRRRISEAEVSAIEAELLATRRPMPPALVYLPVLAGGLLATLPAFDDDLSGAESGRIALFGLSQALVGMASMGTRDPARRYLDDLGKARLRVAVTPGPTGLGAGISGRF